MSSGQLPISVDEMTASWLESALGAGIDSVDVEPIGAGAGFAGSVYRVRMAYADSDSVFPETVIWKTVSEDARSRDFLTALGVYEREARFYGFLAGTVEIAPKSFFSEFDHESGVFCIVMEDLSYMTPGDQVEGCSLVQTLEVATAMARFHSRFWSERIEDCPDWIPRFDSGSGYFERMHSVAWKRLTETMEGIPEGLIETALRIAPRVAEIKARLSRTPVTLAHGDLRGDNLFFGAGGVKLVDWQAIRIGRGMYDLAYFLSTSVPVEVRRRHQGEIIETYVEELRANGVGGYTVADCVEDFRWALLDVVTFVGVIGSTLDFQSARGLELSGAIVSRLWASIEDNSALDLLN